jgi:hypothetical protein
VSPAPHQLIVGMHFDELDAQRPTTAFQYWATAALFDRRWPCKGSAYENNSAASVTATRFDGVANLVERYGAADMAA